MAKGVPKLKPKDIRFKEFRKKFFGYDPEEVEAFLNEVANAYQSLLDEIEQLRKVTPEFKAEQVLEVAKKKIEKYYQEKKKEFEELEKHKRSVEAEIENLKVIQKRMFDKLRVTIHELVELLEELKPDEEETESKGSSKSKEAGSSEGRGSAESKGEVSSGEGESQPGTDRNSG
jgi:cell division initiation protein